MKVVLPFWNGSERSEIELRDRMAAWGVPGVSVAVFEGGEIAWAQGFGVCQTGLEDIVTPQTLFQAGSIGKAVTAVAVLRLVQEGRLDLDTEVNRYLRDWKVPASGAWQPRITLRQLLSHSAGTTVHGFTGYRSGEPVPDLRQILDGTPPARNRPIRVDVLPGTHFRYSGGGTMIAQLVLMDVMCTDFPALMRGLIFDPLGMASSTFERPLPAPLEARTASGHWFGSDVAGGRYYIHPEAAAAGLWTTPSDLARLTIDLQRSWAGSRTGLLQPEVVRAMLQPQIAPHIGLGFFLEGANRCARFGHSGDTFGFNAELACFTETGQGAAIMTNSITSANVIADLLRTIAEAQSWPALGIMRQAGNSDTAERLSLAAGSYELDSGVQIAIGNEDGTPMLRIQGQDPVRLRAHAEGGFFADHLDLKVRVLHDEQGGVPGVRLDQGSETLEAYRIDTRHRHS